MIMLLMMMMMAVILVKQIKEMSAYNTSGAYNPLFSVDFYFVNNFKRSTKRRTLNSLCTFETANAISFLRIVRFRIDIIICFFGFHGSAVSSCRRWDVANLVRNFWTSECYYKIYVGFHVICLLFDRFSPNLPSQISCFKYFQHKMSRKVFCRSLGVP
jgi:hypothetical protein